MNNAFVFEESGFIFDFTGSLRAFVADKPNYCGMAAVDFIVETEDAILFIEVKNPDNKKSTYWARRKFLEELREEVFPQKMGMKFKDTLLCRWGKGERFTKPIRYIILLQFALFSGKERGKLGERILGYIPFGLNHADFHHVIKIENFELLDFNEFRSRYRPFQIWHMQE